MFYDPRENLRPAPLRYNPINALVAPRPIGWISSIDRDGNPNLAPFSYFGCVSADPPVVTFAPNSQDAEGTPKDSLRNVRAVPEFVAHVVSEDLIQQMNQSSKDYPADVNEFIEAGLTAAPSKYVRPPRVAEAKVALECEVHDIVRLPARDGGRKSHLVIGNVIGVHLSDELIEDGRVVAERLRQVSRLGYFEYNVIRDTFELPRPD